MRSKHVIDVTPDQHLNPGAVVVMNQTVEEDCLENILTFNSDPEYFFSVDGREFTPAQFLRVLRRGIKLDELQEYGNRNLPGWTFVVGGKPL